MRNFIKFAPVGASASLALWMFLRPQDFKKQPVAEMGITLTIVGFISAAAWVLKRPESFRANEHLFIQYGTQFVIAAMGLFAARYKEEREQSLKNEELPLLLNKMKMYHSKGYEAFKENNFLSAAGHFQDSCIIFEKNSVHLDADVSAIALYVHCCYQRALALYALHEHYEAKKLIDDTLKSIRGKLSTITNTLTSTTANLLNLSALISFKNYLSEFDGDKKTAFLTNTKDIFNESYRIDKNQTNVSLFLHYIKNNHAFLVAVQPTTIEKNTRILSVHKPDQSDVLSSLIVFLIAEAYANQKAWIESIYLYGSLVPVFQTNPDAFFEMFVVPMQYAKACLALLQSDVTTASFKLSVSKDDKTLPVVYSREGIQALASTQLEIAKQFLKHCQLLGDSHNQFNYQKASGALIVIEEEYKRQGIQAEASKQHDTLLKLEVVSSMFAKISTTLFQVHDRKPSNSAAEPSTQTERERDFVLV